ncbi:MAG: multidrug transporter, partial [Bacteroidetes bacterium]|nr:multidrug transporter [Bacteroidota bacterium]
VKEKDDAGNSSDKDFGKVIEILEHKDILSLPDNTPYKVKYNKRNYSYTKKELIENNEFNSGVYAFKYNKLVELIYSISSNNVQNEIYITDLISLFNKKGYSVTAISPLEQYVVMGFNNKSVLKEMEAVARKKVYERLKDIIEIDDPDDFFIDESVVEDIIEMDNKNIPLDISIGKGVHIDKGVKLNYNLTLSKNVYVSGKVNFGKNVIVHQNVHLSCFAGQNFKISDNVEILSGDIIKGNIIIGEHARIESSVNMTGSDEYPLRIGKNVLIKGTSYIFGSIIEDDVHIEHSVIIKKRVDRLIKRDGTIQPIRFYLPMPEGIDAVEDLE